MADTSSLSTFLTDVADAIRAKKGSTALIPAASFDEEILNLPLEGGSGEVKLFATEEELMADTPAEGDLAVVYSSSDVPLASDMSCFIWKFPETVVLDSAITDTTYPYGNINSNIWINITISPTSVMITIDNTVGGIMENITYTSTDGITYNIADGSIAEIDFGSEITVTWGQWDDVISKFILANQCLCNGLYQCNGTEYVLVPYENSNNSDNIDVPGVKLFATKEEMQTDTTAKEGDLAIIYVNENVPLTSTMSFKTLIFPDTIVLDGAITEQVNVYGNAQDETYVSFYVTSNNAHISISNWQTMLECMVDYTTEDGITYTRSAESQSKINFATPLEVAWGQWNDIIGNFILSNQIVFNGVYQYKDSAYSLAPTQFTAIASNVFDASFYGKNGVEQGTLTTEVSNLFTDVNAKLYMTLQDVYNEMEPIVLEDTDLTRIDKLYSKIPREIYVMPARYDGTAVIDTSNLTVAGYTTSDNIEIGLFKGCTNLRTIPTIDTSNVTDMKYMFQDCNSLITIPLLDTSNVTNMYNMFNNCKNLKTIPLLDTSNVTSMRWMFAYCNSLTAIPALDTSNVTEMTCMFTYCYSLTTIPLINTSNVTSMNQMFSNCKNLISIPLLDTSNVTNMSYIFQHCNSLTTIPLLDTSSVTSMWAMFTNCTNLSDESLNNILAMCSKATAYTSTTNKTLEYIGLTSEQATRCQSLSNYSAFTAAGWTTGY